MNVLHMISNMPITGAASVVCGLSSALIREDVCCEIATTQGHEVSQSYGTEAKTHCFPAWSPVSRWWRAWSPSLSRFLEAEVRRFDLVHIHGLWDYAGFSAFRAAKRHNIPFVISPHGGVTERALRQKRFRKYFYMRMVQARILRSAVAIHCLGDSEVADIARLGIQAPVFVVPNGIPVDLPDIFAHVDVSSFLARHPVLAGKRVILYLGRLHPGKGLPVLIRSFSRVAAKFPDVVLLVAGPDERGTRGKMESELRILGIRERVVFTGFLAGYGRDWVAAFSCADIFVLPSYFEGFSSAIVEAMAAGLPVVISEYCGSICEGVRNEEAGVVVPVQEEPLAEAMASLLADEQRRQRMVGAAQRLGRRYAWPRLAQSMAAHYLEIIERRCSFGTSRLEKVET